MTETSKILLEAYLDQVLKCDNEQLLGHFAGLVRTVEFDLLKNNEDREYSNVLIDKLWDEILNRMNK